MHPAKAAKERARRRSRAPVRTTPTATTSTRTAIDASQIVKMCDSVTATVFSEKITDDVKTIVK